MTKAAAPANKGRTKAYVDSKGRNYTNGRAINKQAQSKPTPKASDPPNQSEKSRREKYEKGLVKYGHALTDKLHAEAKSKGERAPTDRVFQGPPKKWAGDNVDKASGRPRPLKRGGGSPRAEDF